MNFKFVIIDINVKTKSILKKNFEEVFGADVFDFDSSVEAIEYLKNLNDISLIISRNESTEDKFSSNVLNYLYDSAKTTKMLIIGDFDHSNKNFTIIPDKFRVEDVNRQIIKVLEIKKEDLEFLKLPEYISYPISYFYLMNLTPTSIYIKLIKKTGVEYVKRFHGGEAMSYDALRKYEENGLRDFYIHKDDRSLLMNSLLKQTLGELINSKEETKTTTIAKTFSISTDMIRKVGINAEAQILADQTIHQMLKEVSPLESLSTKLRNILNDPSSFTYKRSYLISLLFSAIYSQLDWGSGEQEKLMLQKLTMVSFFHDIFLEDDHLLKIMSHEEYKAVENGLLLNEQDILLNHANKTAVLLSTYPKLPSGVDQIVKQHHGSPNGIGFPESLTTAISPQAIAFVVVEDFANQILLMKKDLKIVDILAQLQMKYTLPSYRKIVQALLSLKK
jgi:hypothetical protein